MDKRVDISTDDHVALAQGSVHEFRLQPPHAIPDMRKTKRKTGARHAQSRWGYK